MTPAGRTSARRRAGDGEREAYAAARLAFNDQGLDLPEDAIRITCSADPCLTPGARVTVSIERQSDLAWRAGPGTWRCIGAGQRHHVEVVDTYRAGAVMRRRLALRRL